jgi:hypothetical protein
MLIIEIVFLFFVALDSRVCFPSTEKNMNNFGQEMKKTRCLFIFSYFVTDVFSYR